MSTPRSTRERIAALLADKRNNTFSSELAGLFGKVVSDEGEINANAFKNEFSRIMNANGLSELGRDMNGVKLFLEHMASLGASEGPVLGARQANQGSLGSQLGAKGAKPVLVTDAAGVVQSMFMNRDDGRYFSDNQAFNNLENNLLDSGVLAAIGLAGNERLDAALAHKEKDNAREAQDQREHERVDAIKAGREGVRNQGKVKADAAPSLLSRIFGSGKQHSVDEMLASRIAIIKKIDAQNLADGKTGIADRGNLNFKGKGANDKLMQSIVDEVEKGDILRFQGKDPHQADIDKAGRLVTTTKPGKFWGVIKTTALQTPEQAANERAANKAAYAASCLAYDEAHKGKSSEDPSLSLPEMLVDHIRYLRDDIKKDKPNKHTQTSRLHAAERLHKDEAFIDMVHSIQVLENYAQSMDSGKGPLKSVTEAERQRCLAMIDTMKVHVMAYVSDERIFSAKPEVRTEAAKNFAERVAETINDPRLELKNADTFVKGVKAVWHYVTNFIKSIFSPNMKQLLNQQAEVGVVTEKLIGVALNHYKREAPVKTEIFGGAFEHLKKQPAKPDTRPNQKPSEQNAGSEGVQRKPLDKEDLVKREAVRNAPEGWGDWMRRAGGLLGERVHHYDKPGV